MFSYLSNQPFVEYVLERGNIPFIVRGNLECADSIDFSPLLNIRTFPPTESLKVTKRKADGATEDIFIRELHEETVFSGEIDLAEKTPRGIAMALWAIERWADFLCLALGNPRIQVEVQLPVNVVITMSGFKLGAEALVRWASFVISHSELEDHERPRIASALWWYRKGCAAANYSLFESYTAYWNCLEIMCSVSGNKIKKGTTVDEQIQGYLNSKKSIRAGDILHCFNNFVNYSIAQQMKDALKDLIGEEQGTECIYQCFEIKPENNRLYQIRNDINHGNIRENSAEDYQRVYLRGMLLEHIVMAALCAKLKYPISIGGLGINDLWKSIAEPFK